MNWYKTISSQLKNKIPKALNSLAIEARKYNNFERFEKAYALEIKRGQYWHITENPNFSIDSDLGPTDKSSLASGEISRGTLMVTSDIRTWKEYYENSRQYAAKINVDNIPKEKFISVNRGFGNEFFIKDSSLAFVEKVVPIKNAIQMSDRYDKIIPQTKEELKKFYFAANNKLLYYDLDKLKKDIAMGAKKIIDDWTQDDDGFDEFLGYGGCCDEIASEIAEIISLNINEIDEIDIVGEDHAFVFVSRGEEKYFVDIPDYLYEIGRGYEWRKKKEINIDENSVEISQA
jgi:hypothetical protein